MSEPTSTPLSARSFSSSTPPPTKQKKKRNQRQKQNSTNQTQTAKSAGTGEKSTKLRGLDRDPPDVRLSKTLSWILRHGASSEGIPMREDGFVKVSDILENGRILAIGPTLEQLKEIVKTDLKQRFSLVYEIDAETTLVYSAVEGEGNGKGVWMIKANQGHSMRVNVQMKPILSVEDIPSRLAVHGTTHQAWDIIQKEGLSKMTRNHIHLAQGVGGDNIISGMRNSSQVLIFVNVQKALDAGIKFQLSDNGVVLTEGNESGCLASEFFYRVEDARTRRAIDGWEGSGPIDNEYMSTKAAMEL